MTVLTELVRGVILPGEPLSRHTTYGIGGPAAAYVRPRDRRDLQAILRYTDNEMVPVFFIGSGSNLLVSDGGFDGVVITLTRALTDLRIEEGRVVAEAGVMLGHMVRKCVHNGLTGMESLIGVPGTMGGALIMNAGAFQGEISRFLVQVTTMMPNGELRLYPRAELRFDYRHSSFRSGEIIIEAEFEFPPGDSDTIIELKSSASRERKARQPLTKRSAGSVFKNPGPELTAGYLIDSAGLKGVRRGGAEISEKHANFFINLGAATAEDVAFLIRLVAKTVKRHFDVQLKLEIKTLGFPEDYWEDAGVA